MDPNGGHRFPGDEEPAGVEMRRSGFWTNALLGAVATVLIGMLPLVQLLAPVAGGEVVGGSPWQPACLRSPS